MKLPFFLETWGGPKYCRSHVVPNDLLLDTMGTDAGGFRHVNNGNSCVECHQVLVYWCLMSTADSPILQELYLSIWWYDIPINSLGFNSNSQPDGGCSMLQLKSSFRGPFGDSHGGFRHVMGVFRQSSLDGSQSKMDDTYTVRPRSIAKLVHITPISLWFVVLITN